MRHRIRALFLPALALTLLAGVPACRGPYANKPGPVTKQPDTWVRVTNNAWLDVNVYLIQGSQRYRLGTVNSTQSARFKLPAGAIFGPTTVSFLVDPIGSNRTAQSFEIMVTPGEEVTLTIPPSLR